MHSHSDPPDPRMVLLSWGRSLSSTEHATLEGTHLNSEGGRGHLPSHSVMLKFGGQLDCYLGWAKKPKQLGTPVGAFLD